MTKIRNLINRFLGKVILRPKHPFYDAMAGALMGGAAGYLVLISEDIIIKGLATTIQRFIAIAAVFISGCFLSKIARLNEEVTKQWSVEEKRLLVENKRLEEITKRERLFYEQSHKGVILPFILACFMLILACAVALPWKDLVPKTPNQQAREGQVDRSRQKLSIVDKELNELYKTIMANLSQDQKAMFKKEQDEWIKRLESACANEANRVGPKDSPAWLNKNIDCTTRMTKDRISQLKDYRDRKLKKIKNYPAVGK